MEEDYKSMNDKINSFIRRYIVFVVPRKPVGGHNIFLCNWVPWFYAAYRVMLPEKGVLNYKRKHDYIIRKSNEPYFS